MKKFLSILLFMSALFAISVTTGNENGSLLIPRAEALTVKSVNASHILVPTEAQAEKIRSEILDGAATRKEIYDNFTAAAKKYSKCPSGRDGGALGWFKHGDMVPAFETAAFNQEEGTVSQPVKTQYGWHLIYVQSKRY